MIANFLIAFTIIFTDVYYCKYSEEIEEEVSNVVAFLLKDVNNSSAEHEIARK